MNGSPAVFQVPYSSFQYTISSACFPLRVTLKWIAAADRSHGLLFLN